MQICNACRYCEGFCAVFPAMTRRLEFGKADIHFLANLCHNCGACLHACQYAPPHEFAVNVPQAMAQVRGQTYVDYAWPPALGALYQRNGLTLSLALAAGLALFLLLARGAQRHAVGRRPAAATSTTCSRTTCWSACSRRCSCSRCWRWALGVRRFWRDVTPATSGAAGQRAGGGRGHRRRAAPEVPRWRPRRGLQQRRRRLHAVAPALPSPHLLRLHAVLCRHQRGHALPLRCSAGSAPYDLPSLPKLLGAVGGVSLLLGTAGLLRLNLQAPSAARRRGTKADGPGLHRAAVPHQPSGLALWLGARHAGPGAAAGRAPGRGDGAVRHAALRQVRATAFSAPPRCCAMRSKSASPTRSGWAPTE